MLAVRMSDLLIIVYSNNVSTHLKILNRRTRFLTDFKKEVSKFDRIYAFFFIGIEIILLSLLVIIIFSSNIYIGVIVALGRIQYR